MKTFIVGPCDALLGDSTDMRSCRIVKATTEQKALEKYWADYEPTEYDLEYCCSMRISTSILAVFLRDDVGYIVDYLTGNYRKDIRQAFEGDEAGLRDYVRKVVEARVRDFFDGHPDYAEAFMAGYDQSLANPESDIRFPRDMLVFMLRRCRPEGKGPEVVSVIVWKV